MILSLMIMKFTFFFSYVDAMKTIDLDMTASQQAIVFISSWLRTPKRTINLILPTKHHFKVEKVVKIAKKLTNRSNDRLSFQFVSKFKKIENRNIFENEILWFPFESENMVLKCETFLSNSNSPTSTRFYLLFVGTYENVRGYYEDCELLFDSNIVVYYRANSSISIIDFEEIYKIVPGTGMRRNILGTYDVDSNHFDLSRTDSYIWNRRNNLHMAQFTAITENYYPFIDNIPVNKSEPRKYEVNPNGYFADIMFQLTKTLNFTTKTYVLEKRNNWTHYFETMKGGKYDIGNAWYSFTLQRKSHVDFSFGIIPFYTNLFYVRGSKKVAIGIYSNPFEMNTFFNI